MGRRLSPTKRAAKLVDRAVFCLADAARLLSDAGHEQAARHLNTASWEAANAICQAESDERGETQ